MTFPGYGVGTKCNNHVANQSVHRKLLGMMSNAYDFLKTAKFYAHIDWHDKTDQNKYYCNSSDNVLSFRPRRAQRKCPQMIGTTTDKRE